MVELLELGNPIDEKIYIKERKKVPLSKYAGMKNGIEVLVSYVSSHSNCWSSIKSPHVLLCAVVLYQIPSSKLFVLIEAFDFWRKLFLVITEAYKSGELQELLEKAMCSWVLNFHFLQSRSFVLTLWLQRLFSECF